MPGETEKDRLVGQCCKYSQEWVTWAIVIDMPDERVDKLVALLGSRLVPHRRRRGTIHRTKPSHASKGRLEVSLAGFDSQGTVCPDREQRCWRGGAITSAFTPQCRTRMAFPGAEIVFRCPVPCG
jgi:hypothetical protein